MVSFGAKPAEGVDPWKAARDAYDTTLENAIVQVETTANAAATKAYADGIKATADAALPSATFDTRLATRVKVDNTVGRTIHVWDAANGRWQLVYGDTGWRDVTSEFTNVTSGQVFIKRENYTVKVRCVALSVSASTGSVVLPSGWRPVSNGNYAFFQASSQAGVLDTLFAPGAISFIKNGGSSALFHGETAFSTDNTWPTVLPGTASGSIPNA